MKEPFRVIPLVVGSLATNCYLIVDSASSDTLIIDPGDDAEYIERIIQDNKFHPQKIIATHGHFDHILGVLELQLAYSIPFFINKKDAFLVANMKSSASYFLKMDVGPVPLVDGDLKEKEEIVIGKTRLFLIETPGHTPGSVCLYEKEDGFLFVGDLLFAHGGLGRTDFSYSDRKKLENSLVKIFQLPDKTIIYSGHGDPSTLEEEKFYHS